MNFAEKVLSTFGYRRISDGGSYSDIPPLSQTRYDASANLSPHFRTPEEVKSDFRSDGKVSSDFKTEVRAEDISWSALRGGIDTGAAIINPRLAENLSTVLACIGAISSAMASLPAYVYRVDGNSRTIDEGHPVARLVSQGTNSFQSWSDWVEWTMAQVLLRGNAISEIVTDGRGAVIGLRPVPWEWCSVQMLPSGRLVYDVVEIEAIYGGTGRPRRLLQDEVLHLRDRSDDGILGRSRLQRAAAVVTGSLTMQETQLGFYERSMSPSGAIELPESVKMSPETKEAGMARLRDLFRGPSRAGKVLILDQGAKWKQLSLSPEDAEFLESRRFSTEELCRLFNVPPVIVGDLSNSSFNNTETLTRFFSQQCLAPWVAKLEAEFARSVLSNGRRLEIDLSGLMRGDPDQRWRSHEIAVKNGILTVDEIREIEGYSPRAAAV